MMTINYRDIQNYEDEVRSVITEGEGFERTVYDDGVNHIPTIGYGYALIIDNGDNWVVKSTLEDDLESLGVTLSLGDQLILDQIASALNGDTETTAEEIMDDYEFDLTVDEDEANSLFDAERERAENAIEDQLARHLNPERAAEIFTNLSETHELVALTSLVYTNYTLIGPGLSSALDEGNRAEAWYEIRYASNGGDDAGIAKRRYHESHIFGLYDEGVDAETITNDQARQVYRMFNRRRDDILDYESRYGVNPDGSNGNRNMIAEANEDYSPGTDIPTLEEALSPATGYLMEEYVTSLDESLTETIDFQNIWVDRLDNEGDSQGSGDGVPTMSGCDENDLLVRSNSGSDLKGVKGNDVLWGEEKKMASQAGGAWMSLKEAPAPTAA
ncbi:hypothetical protein OOT55_13465 [Marinimicrobium sp. C6131]|uniref:hypothetical protein n=1 Tax=Marinimicrobium sp. C6131 TaxID=3022676 RepID=UPI00223C9173|nr:hypothetical protein [Marinimicrobium sp. C6131]UZJ43658.1 hypothetical protein OOT55_13465 [Marinimicrobium sp. C6131]